MPAAAMLRNQTNIAGPNSAPTFSVPRRWIQNSTTISTSEIGTIQGCASLVATPMPSTAEMTEIAGVITPSPKSIAAPTTTITTKPGRFGRDAALGPRQQQRQQRQDAALAVVVDPHDDAHVLDADDDDQRPDDQGEDPQHVLRGHADVGAREARLEGVERARPDVAVDHPEGRHGQAGLELARLR